MPCQQRSTSAITCVTAALWMSTVCSPRTWPTWWKSPMALSTLSPGPCSTCICRCHGTGTTTPIFNRCKTWCCQKRPPELVDLLQRRQRNEPYDQQTYDECLKNAVAQVVQQQAEVGVDVVSDGEFGKSSWFRYLSD